MNLLGKPCLEAVDCTSADYNFSVDDHLAQSDSVLATPCTITLRSISPASGRSSPRGTDDSLDQLSQRTGSVVFLDIKDYAAAELNLNQERY
jgi:hypothetical protein